MNVPTNYSILCEQTMKEILAVTNHTVHWCYICGCVSIEHHNGVRGNVVNTIHTTKFMLDSFGEKEAMAEIVRGVGAGI